MKTSDLNKKIKELTEKKGITKYRVDGMALKMGNYSIAKNGELKCDLFIDIRILPLRGYHEIPITFTVKNTD